jgi:hypothetical protein
MRLGALAPEEAYWLMNVFRTADASPVEAPSSRAVGASLTGSTVTVTCLWALVLGSAHASGSGAPQSSGAPRSVTV